jgi:hypothetical protein
MMSLDISLYNRKTGEDIIEMNWLRNPFGLERWASDNANLEMKKDLWYVCNHWNYKKASRVNRGLFKSVVDKYWEVISNLTEGFFCFDLPAYRQFVEGKTQFMVQEDWAFGQRIKGAKYEGERLAIPMWQFTPQVIDLGGKNKLEDYQEWFRELVRFAELLQNENYRLYCSN